MNPIENIQAYVPTSIHFSDLLQFAILLLGGIACLVFDAVSTKEVSRKYLPMIAAGALVMTMASCFFNILPPPTETFIEGAFRSDEFGQLGALVILFAFLMMTTIMPSLVKKRNLPAAEVYSLTLFAAFGAVLLAIANELLTAFIVLEIMSLSLYVLIGIDRKNAKSTEACFKYFILGAFASAFLVLGIAFLFGATHTTFLTEMAEVFKAGGVVVTEAVVENGVTIEPAVVQALNPMYVFLGFGLLFVGMCFKLTAAPFHMYAPDVYEGGNTPTVMVVATSSKVAAFAFLLHVLEAMSHWPVFTQPVIFVVGFVAIVSMVWGNVAALVQVNFKRMMAYSSIAHTGYMLVGAMVYIALPNMLEGEKLEMAMIAVRQAILLYLAGYTVTSVLSFGTASYIDGEDHMDAYRGLIFRKPAAAIGMAIAMFSLVGIGFTPPTIGFMGKFYLFKEAIQYGFVALAVIAVLASAVSAWYYLSLVVKMFMREVDDTQAVRLAGTRKESVKLFSFDSMTRIILFASSILIFILGVFPTMFISLGESLVYGFTR
ncbi:MAG: NADH-quinone oxidoreductase subunit N [Candidatus Sumerlaeia bacterium]|nr:NADH-quinone oxidoreductase subunit N [Candidatus Sumerlaeia bacterium]